MWTRTMYAESKAKVRLSTICRLLEIPASVEITEMCKLKLSC